MCVYIYIYIYCIHTWVCSRPVRKCHIMDMQRGMKKDKLGDLYSGIEVIKNDLKEGREGTAD